ncbi:MAG: DNA helicase [Rhodocyclaceae bacterium]|nr:DNA helicase [Rhodocyclaceae bacterium]
MTDARDPQTLLAIDALARSQALDPCRSFIIDAPAGAGKTELLTQRFLRLLTCVDEPEEIIALTFTNKAAGEMRDRIMLSLRSAAEPPDPDTPPHKQQTWRLASAVLEQNSERGWQLLQQPTRLRVMTLDALSARIARQMPLLSRFGAQPAVTNDPGRYYEQAARNTLDQLEDGTEASTIIEHALAYFDNDAGRLQKMLVSMLARRDQWAGLAFGEYGQQDANALALAVSNAMRALIANQLIDVVDRFPAARQATWMAAARYAADLSPDSPVHLLADWQHPLGTDPEDLPRWRALAELFLTKGNEPRSVYRAPICIAGATHQPQRQVLLDAITEIVASGDVATLASIRELPDPELSNPVGELVAALAALLRLAYTQLWLVFHQEKSVDFSEIAMRAVEAIGSDDAPGEIRERLDYRLRHLLVDEFQDTSPLQVGLLEHLTAGWEHEPDRSIFLVGDPMQSIYRFRKADVGLFLRVRKNGLGKIRPASLQLYRNNRSHPEIIDWVNTTFGQVFAPDDDIIRGAVRYEPCVAGKPAEPMAGVTIHPLITGEQDSDTADNAPRSLADEREAAIITHLIHTARSDNPKGTIAVLVRARPHLDALITQLQAIEPRIPFRAVEINALAARQSVQDLVSLTRALHARGDRLHWLAILRAPWCGLTLADLHQLAADDHMQTLWSLMQDDNRISRLSADGQRRLRPLRQALLAAYTHQGVQRARRWVEGVWHAIGGPDCLNSESDVEDVQAYFRLLDSLDTHGELALDRLDEALGRLFATPDTSDDSGHVQLMTIHKSKGLQFDTVIVPGLHRTPPNDGHALLLWDTLILDDDGQEHLVVAPAPAPGSPNGSAPTPYALLRALERTRAQNEDRRVLYVAATRAIRQLHLLGVAKRNTKSDAATDLKPPATNSLLAPLWPVIGANFVAAAAQPSTPMPPASQIDPATFVPRLVRVATPRTAAITTQPSVVTPDQPLHLFDSTPEMDIGTMVHQYLEAIAQDGLDAWSHQRIEALLPRFSQNFAQLGYPPEEINTAAQVVCTTLQRALTEPMSRWILSTHEAAGCEVPLSNLAASILNDAADATIAELDEIHRHVIDRTFIENGVRWIIDYKTLRIDQTLMDNDLEAHLEAKAATYQPQLERYAALYAHEAERGITIRTAIFFPAHGKLITF